MPDTMNLYEYGKERAKLSPDRPMIGDETRWLTALETLSLSEHMAARFLSVGIRPGDYVALRANRSLLMILALIGLRTIGAVVVLVDPRQKPDGDLAGSLSPIPLSATVEQLDRNTFRVFTGKGQTAFDLFDLPPARLHVDRTPSDAPAFIIFTSGSTGEKKAVVLSEQNMISNLLDSAPLGGYQPNDIALGALPIDHVFGLVLLCGVAVLGYALFLPEKTDVTSLLQTIEQRHITRMNGVPALYLAMCEKAASYDLSSLHAGFIGGSPVSSEQFARIEETLGITLVSVYGMSECIGIACTNATDPRAVRQCCVGPFYPMNTGRILLEDGTEAKPGEEGEIFIKGPMRMLGYYGEPMDPETLFPTGDLGYLDENGRLHISGRKKLIIIRNGNNLSPIKIEQALLSLPYVSAAVVAGIPDPKQGEVPAAMVVTDWDAEELMIALSSCVQKNELPVVLKKVPAIPLTASGKPDRIAAQKELAKWQNG